MVSPLKPTPESALPFLKNDQSFVTNMPARICSKSCSAFYGWLANSTQYKPIILLLSLSFPCKYSPENLSDSGALSGAAQQYCGNIGRTGLISFVPFSSAAGWCTVVTSSEFTVLITDDTAQQKLKPVYITLVVLGPILLAATRVFTILASGIRLSKRATTTSSISLNKLVIAARWSCCDDWHSVSAARPLSNARGDSRTPHSHLGRLRRRWSRFWRAPAAPPITCPPLANRRRVKTKQQCDCGQAPR
jgi:hypothetical protein